MNVEAILAAGYALGLIASAFTLEWLSAHTHRRSLRYRTAGFSYDAAHDHWQCPEGQHLWPHEFDPELRLVRYRAKAHVCNACPRKAGCTDSDRGREIVRPIDPWPHSEAGRFHRGLALLMVGLGGMIVLAEATRHHSPIDAAALGGVLAIAILAASRLARDLRAHPASFPAASPADGVRLTVTGAPASRWASQNRRPR